MCQSFIFSIGRLLRIIWDAGVPILFPYIFKITNTEQVKMGKIEEVRRTISQGKRGKYALNQICIYLYVSVCICMYLYVYLCTHMYLYEYISIYIYLYIFLSIFIYFNPSLFKSIYRNLSVYICIYMYL